MAASYAQRARGRSISQPSPNDEINCINNHYEFINKTYKRNLSEMERIISYLRSRLSAEDAYITSLNKMKKASNTDNDMNNRHTSSLMSAYRHYWSTLGSLIESRQYFRDTLIAEIDALTQKKEAEEMNRKTFKSRLSEDNQKYIDVRNNKIGKLHRNYNLKCEELKQSQENWDQAEQQQQQQQQQQLLQVHNVNEEPNEFYRPNRNSAEIASHRLSGDSDYASSFAGNSNLDYYKKNATNFFTQMKTRAMGTYPPTLDQTKQISKVAKMKKDITEADTIYRKGIIELEDLRKQQVMTAVEVNTQLRSMVKNKADSVKGSLKNILKAEMMTLKHETKLATDSYAWADAISSDGDVNLFDKLNQNQRPISPTPVCYENYYLKGRCKEVLFGGSLETYVKEHNRAVPLIVTKCIVAIESMNGLQKEGIYRVSGRQSNVEQLKHQFELDEEKLNIDSRYDVFTIATILKMYIRELDTPLLDLNDQAQTIYNSNITKERRHEILINKISSLSYAQRCTLQQIIAHLSRVNSNSQFNKMHVQNLAVIFIPVIFHHFNQTEENTIDDWHLDIVFEDLVLNSDRVFYEAENIVRSMSNKNRTMAPSISQNLHNESIQLHHKSEALPIMTRSLPLARAGSNSPVSPNDHHNNAFLTTIIGQPIPQTMRSASLAAASHPKKTHMNYKSMHPITIDTSFVPKLPHNQWPSHDVPIPSPSTASSIKQPVYPANHSNDSKTLVINKSQSETTGMRTSSKPASTPVEHKMTPTSDILGSLWEENFLLATQHNVTPKSTSEQPSGSPVQTIKLGYSNSAPPRQDSLKKVENTHISNNKSSNPIKHNTNERVQEQDDTKATQPAETANKPLPPVQTKENDELLDDYYCFDDDDSSPTSPKYLRVDLN
ncbi:hypothetical protein BDB01DRAFT_906082 [Pilobolus umbonatus]|nr:hypothetical protein BDB01DRAFT_906082 [Pilobolus umbonatus]